MAVPMSQVRMVKPFWKRTLGLYQQHCCGGVLIFLVQIDGSGPDGLSYQEMCIINVFFGVQTLDPGFKDQLSGRSTGV